MFHKIFKNAKKRSLEIMEFENMTNFRHQTTVLALVAAGLFPPVTLASPNYGTVRGQNPTGSRQMEFEQERRNAGVERGTRNQAIPNEHQFRPIVEGQWIAPRAADDGSHAGKRMMDFITPTLANPNYRSYRFGAPNAGFEIDARVEGGGLGVGSQVIFMLRQDVRSEDEFRNLQQTLDPLTRKPYISQNAQWQGEGKYPVGAFLAGKDPRGADVPSRALNPYDYVDDPGRFSAPDPRTGKVPTAVVQLFGLPKDQAGVAHGQVRVDFQQDFPAVQGRSGISNVFGKIFGGGQQQQQQQYPQQQYPQQQYPGQQPGQSPQQRPADCPSATGAALGSFLGGLARGQDAKQAAAQAAAAAARTSKPRGCE